ncbi:serine hydrolase domain-containing protein [Virgisporangium ochraceum]|uniref:Serine hydrolase n=1 Tax=Virgisporangium ochraceum TaxID=65505 RepID=A0A8J4A0J1_9ACTN|nr:serine hydrolase domain-containing protein [Virgisporangium ochraceum]GIJ71880.1 serine hydrolase [Virgisporangium ochraceum]
MTLEQTIDPDHVGFDAKRLDRIRSHFERYVDDGRLAGWHIVVTRCGQVAFSGAHGTRDLSTGAPVEADTLWRIYSMTKPVTSVAAMMLYEEGHFQLTDEISRWLPEFADLRVYTKGSLQAPFTVPAIEPIRVWHLLTHTSGLTYGFIQETVVDGLYRSAGSDLSGQGDLDLAESCGMWAGLPLLFQPGTRWGYGVSTDVLGRLVEVISGQTLEEFFAERVLGPLGMDDTRWWVDEADAPRAATLYGAHPQTGLATPLPKLGAEAFQRPALLSGGAGLISTAADYHRFTQMLLREGELDGVRLLGPHTVRYMTRNHLPGGADLQTFSSGGFAETTMEGIGFGLGFAVIDNPVPGKVLSGAGQYYWGGLASTAFWVDPVEQLTAMLFTQLVPSSRWPLRAHLRQLVYQALID